MQKTDDVHRELMQADGREWFTVPAWGYLEGFELRPRRELPNMDAAVPYRLAVLLLDPQGQPVPMDVLVTCRNVSDGAAGAGAL